MAEPQPLKYQADVVIQAAFSRDGLVCLTLACGDATIAAVMSPDEAGDVAEMIQAQARRARVLVESN